jgi:hypothetical protein
MKFLNQQMSVAAIMILLLLIFCGFSCSPDSVSDPTCNETEIKAIPTYDFMPLNSGKAHLQNIDENSTFFNLMIGTQSDFEKYVVLNPDFSPTIDFTTQLLVAGRIIRPKCAEINVIEINGNCNEYACNVVIQDFDCDALTLLDYFILIDKTNAEITFTYTQL